MRAVKVVSFVVLCFVCQVANCALPCALKPYPYGYVCVCNSSYCDILDDVHPKGPGEFVVVSSSKGGLRFSITRGSFLKDSDKVVIRDYDARPIETVGDEYLIIKLLEEAQTNYLFGTRKEATITIDRNEKYQEIVGFGGAFTGAVSYNLDKLAPEVRDGIYKSYFSKTDGIGYSFIRMPIGGCDSDLQPWAYNEEPKNDVHLSNFSALDPRDEKKVEQLKDLMKASNNFDIKFFGSAWSPPPWMKSNNAWTGFSWLKDEYYQTWADYHIRFIELMEAKNISFWAISTGNEPLNGSIQWIVIPFMSLGWSPKTQAKWVAKHLGPSLRQSAFSKVKLFGNDDQRYTFPWWFDKMEKGVKNSTSFLDGLAIHFYWDEFFHPNYIDKTHKKYKDKMIINTESCVGDKPLETHGPELGSWTRAEKYVRSYIEDLQHWVNGWIDWNIVLDERGGPNYVKNTVDAPIIANTTSGTEFYKQPIFYAIGHFSKFLTENSVHISSSSSDRRVDNVAFARPDGSIVVIILNIKDNAFDVSIHDKVSGNIALNIPPRSVHTIIYK